jgi:hypothetical protein
MIYEELSGKIIGAAMEVLNELKPGLDEKLYETRNDHRTEAPWPQSIVMSSEVETSLIASLYATRLQFLDLCHYEPKSFRSLNRNNKSPVTANLPAQRGRNSRTRFQVSMQEAGLL